MMRFAVKFYTIGLVSYISILYVMHGVNLYSVTVTRTIPDNRESCGLPWGTVQIWYRSHLMYGTFTQYRTRWCSSWHFDNWFNTRTPYIRSHLMYGTRMIEMKGLCIIGMRYGTRMAHIWYRCYLRYTYDRDEGFMYYRYEVWYTYGAYMIQVSSEVHVW